MQLFPIHPPAHLASEVDAPQSALPNPVANRSLICFEQRCNLADGQPFPIDMHQWFLPCPGFSLPSRNRDASCLELDGSGDRRWYTLYLGRKCPFRLPWKLPVTSGKRGTTP